MKEVEMTLGEISNNFGKDVADQCETMLNGETREFYVVTYEAIIVRCVRSGWFGTTYYVKGELVLEEALELDNGMDMGMDM